MSFIRVLLAPTAELALKTVADVTVEAEYGKVVAEGRDLTLAHHQKEGMFSTAGGAPAPCNAGKVIEAFAPRLKERLADAGTVTILVSHIDLDTIGGIGRIVDALMPGSEFSTRLFAGFDAFWKLAEFVDLNGAHKLDQAQARMQDEKALFAWWAWSQSKEGNMRPAADQVTEITDYVFTALGALKAILVEGSIPLLSRGEDFMADQRAKDRDSFISLEEESGVVVRCYSGFVNHLYAVHNGLTPRHGRAVVAFNPAQGSISISLADSIPGVSCREIVQQMWGPEAGGHDNIAGGPRGKRMTLLDLVMAYENVCAAINEARRNL